MTSEVTIAQLSEFLERVFPQVHQEFAVDHIADGQARLRLIVGTRHLRPGGTVSGPSIFALADVAMYAAVFSKAGPKALAVTTNCAIDFMRKPPANQDLLGHARILKFGKQLAVGDVLITAPNSDVALARASLTYALPPKGSSSDILF